MIPFLKYHIQEINGDLIKSFVTIVIKSFVINVIVNNVEELEGVHSAIHLWRPSLIPFKHFLNSAFETFPE